MKYLIGTLNGGVAESPKEYISGPYDIITAPSSVKAVQIYNEKHNCGFFYGHVIAIFVFGKPIVTSKYCSIYDVEEAISEINPQEPVKDEPCADCPSNQPVINRICGYAANERFILDTDKLGEINGRKNP